MTLVQKIRESVNNCPSITQPLFVYGRSSDTALDAAKELNTGTLVYLEPITKTGTTDVQTQIATVVIGFLTQDQPDSESDEYINEESIASMEEKVNAMETEALDWLEYLFENYTLRLSGTYSLTPIFRIKNVMTGVFLTFNLVEPKEC